MGDGAPGLLPLAVLLAAVVAVAYRLALAHAAVAGVSRTRLREMGEEGNRRAAYLATLLGQRDAVHGALRLAFAVTLVATATCAWHLARLAGDAPTWWAGLVAALLLPLVAELLPRVVAARQAGSVALRQARWIGAWFRALGAPALWAVRETERGDADDEGTEESIRELVDQAPLGEARRRRITEILEFPAKTAADIMVPRVDMVAVPAEATLAEAAEEFVRSGYSRLPVYRESRDEITGILHAKDVVRALPSDLTAGGLSRAALFVPEGMRLDQLLRELRARRSSTAIVIDDYGGTAGMVTVEDIIEEIVGDIEDETDPIEMPVLRPRPEGGWIASARLPLDELADALALALPDESEVSTLGGLAMSLSGDLPRPGEVAVVDSNGSHLLILTLGREGTRLTELAVLALEDEPRQPAPLPEPEPGQALQVSGDVALAELAVAVLDEPPPETTALVGELFAFWPAGLRCGQTVYWRALCLEVLDEAEDGGLTIAVRPEG